MRTSTPRVMNRMRICRQTHGDPQDHFFDQAVQHLMSDRNDDGTVYTFYHSGREHVPGSVRKAFEEDKRFRLIGEKHRVGQLVLYYAVPDGIAMVTLPRGVHPNVSIDATTLDPRMFSTIQIVANASLYTDPDPGEINIMVQTPRGYSLKSIGLVSADLERDNYPDPVLSGYDHVVSCLKSTDPCGRLIILEGPPGTGKSYLIRALIRDVKAHFIIIPCMLLGQLSGPTLLPVLLDAKADDEDGEILPIVLVVEDADSALVNRERGDPSKLSEMLNLGDGLLGELGDLRIVATTNAKKVDIDEAALRPGRLCRHVAVTDLDGQQADQVRTRLTGDVGNPYTGPRSLAQVYSDARDDGWLPPKREEKSSSGQYL